MTATLVLRQVRYESLAFWRNPVAAFFSFAFPLIFLVLFQLVLAEPGAGGGTDAALFYTPAIVTFSVVNVCFTSMAMTVSLARDEGILKRIRGTPLPGLAYLVARMIHAALVTLLLVVIVAVAGGVLFGTPLPLDRVPALVVILVIGAGAFCALGLAVAGLVPNAAAAPALVNAIVLPLYFVSDVFVRLEPGSPLALLGDLFPIRHLANALQSVWTPAAHPLDPADLVWVAAWGALGLLVALRTFSWEPRV